MRESLHKQPASVICNDIFLPALEDEHKRSYKNMVRLNLAHVLMLVKQNIIPNENAGVLIRQLLEMYETEGDLIGNDPLLEDYYFNFEKYIIQKCGMEAGGAMHTARSRNDLGSTIIRMNVRPELFKVLRSLEKLVESILKLAEEHTETVMTGYTHMQPAQPTTFSHYLLGVSEGLCRDLKRLENSYETLNLSPLGACAFAGTSFPIDRNMTAGLLGFSGVVENTIDAVASRDYLLEIMGDLTIMGSTLCRFTQDLYVWSTDEFGYLEVDDSLACCSSIMPQKKNPLVLEHSKSKAAHLIGVFTDIVCLLRTTPYGHCRDLGEAMTPFWYGMKEAETVLELLTEAVRTLKVNTAIMGERADKNYCTVTELADAIVKKCEIPFRTAHRMIGNMVRNSVDRGLNSDSISIEEFDCEFQKEFGKSSGFTEGEFKALMSGRNSIENKDSCGASSPDNCREMIGRQRDLLDKLRDVRIEREDKLNEAFKDLYERGKNIVRRKSDE